MGALQKSNGENNALTPERRLINEALARIGQGAATETRRGVEVPPARVSKPGKLIFAIDLTASREHTLSSARTAIAAMFDTLRTIGAEGLALKLVYFRGQECQAGGWEYDAAALKRSMAKLWCEAGRTQIAKVLRMALAEADLSGVVLIGDACEEDPEELYELATALGKKKVPLFIFHDWAGRDTHHVEAARPVFNRMAEWSHGAYCPFGTGSAAVLRELLSTIGAFSAGGIEAVKQAPQVATPEARQLKTRLLLAPGGNVTKGCI